MASLQFAYIAALFAQSSEFPVGTALSGLLFFGPVGAFSTVCLFASDETLRGYASIIGTKNPLAARAVCGIGAVVGFLFAIVSGLALLGFIK